MIEAFYMSQQVQSLGERGFIESFARKDWFEEYFSGLKRAYPKADFVEGVGRLGVQQIVFLPKMRRAIKARLKRDLREFEARVASTKKALASMDA